MGIIKSFGRTFWWSLKIYTPGASPLGLPLHTALNIQRLKEVVLRYRGVEKRNKLKD